MSRSDRPCGAATQREAMRQLEDLVDALFGDRAVLETSKRGGSYQVSLRLSGSPTELLSALRAEAA